MLKFFMNKFSLFIILSNLFFSTANSFECDKTSMILLNNILEEKAWYESAFNSDCSKCPPGNERYKCFGVLPVGWEQFGNYSRMRYDLFSCTRDYFSGYKYSYDKVSNDVLKYCLPSDSDLQQKAPINASINNANPKTTCGSIIQTSNQVIGETIPLVGVPFYITHLSNSVVGRKGDYTSKFKIVNATKSLHVTGFKVEVFDDAQNLLQEETYAGSSPREFVYFWNGLDINNNETWGAVNRNFKLKTMTDNNSISDQSFVLKMGSLKAKKLGLGGWLPSIWHFYDSLAEKVYNGDGSVRNVKAVHEGVYNRVASADGAEVYYFDSIGRVAFTKTGLTGAILYSFSYDQVSQKLLSIIDAFNKKTRFSYDSNGNLAQIISAENVKTYFTMDQNGYLKTVTNAKNETYTIVSKDADGLLASFTKPNGVKTIFTYDEEGNLLTDVNSGGQSTTLSKSEVGINAISTLGRVKKNSFDAATNSEVEIRPSGLATTYVHAPELQTVSNAISTTKKNLVKDLRFGDQVMGYSKTETINFGTVTTNIEDVVDLDDLTNPFSVVTLTKSIVEGSSELNSHYDGLTRTNTLTSKLGRSIAIQLDSLERPIFEQSGDNYPKKYFYQNDLLTKITQGDREIKLAYNPSNKLLASVKNSMNQEVSFYYDQAQRLSAKRLPDGRVVNFQYDLNNNLVSITPPGRPAHKLNYGATEQLSSYVPPSLQGVSSVNTVYSYSKDKELVKIARPDGQVINLNYDLTSGLLSSITGSFGTIAREYTNELVTKITDQNNQVARLGYTGSVVSSLAITDSNQNTVYNYQRTPSLNASGRVGSETIGAGSKTQSIDYLYDDDKMLTKAGELNLEYNSPNGQLVKTSLDNIVEQYFYNKLGEIKTYEAKLVANGKETLLYRYKLERDRLGRITKKLEEYKEEDKKHRHGHEKNRNSDEKIESEYTYDRAGRLIHAHGFRRNSVYLYDKNSNRVAGQAGGEPFVAIYDQQDRLIRFNQSLFSYNPNGELFSRADRVKLEKDGGRDNKKANKGPTYINSSFIYDVFGNLKQAGKITYQIDPLQRRSVRLVNGVVTNKYIYNPEGQLIGELDKNNDLIKTFVYASKSHVPDYFVDQNNERFKLIVDQLGSVRLVVKASTGEIVQNMNHDEFGKVLADTKPMAQPFGFAGGLYDSETKLIRFGVRDYDSVTGRWTAKDPIRFNGGDANLYGYVMSDPVNFIDPSGLIFENFFARHLTPGQQAAIGTSVAALGGFLVAASRSSIPAALASGVGIPAAVGTAALGAFFLYEGGINAVMGGNRILNNATNPIQQELNNSLVCR